MYLVAVAWLYVVLLMAARRGTAANGSWLGALFTLSLYGAAAAGDRALPAEHAGAARGAAARRAS